MYRLCGLFDRQPDFHGTGALIHIEVGAVALQIRPGDLVPRRRQPLVHNPLIGLRQRIHRPVVREDRIMIGRHFNGLKVARHITFGWHFDPGDVIKLFLGGVVANAVGHAAHALCDVLDAAVEQLPQLWNVPQRGLAVMTADPGNDHRPALFHAGFQG